MDRRRLYTDEEESGPLAELLRRHGPFTFEAPQESHIGTEEEESGLLAEMVRLQGQVEEPIVAAALVCPPTPLLKVPRGSNGSTGQALLRRQGQLEELAMAPCMYQRRLNVNSMAVAGVGGDVATIDKFGAASASLVQQQQVAVRSWVAQAELAGLSLPPDLIQESVHAARYAQMQMRMEEQGGMGDSRVHEMLEYSQGHAEVEKPALAFPVWLEEGRCLGASQEEGGVLEGMLMLEALMLQDGGMQEGGMMWGGRMEGAMLHEGGTMQSCSFEAPLGCTVQEGQGMNSMDPALSGGLAGPASACLNSHDDASLAASPASRLAVAAVAAAACPLPAFFTPTALGVCCTSGCAGACCSPAATPGVCHEGEWGHAVTVQEPPATWTSLIGSEKVLQWSKVRGVSDEREVIKAEWAVRKEETGVKEAKRKEGGWEGEDWRPRIRARLDGQAVGLGCIQARSMKERHRRDRIRRGLEKIRRVLPPSLTRAQLDTATMVESALSHIRDLQVQIEALENSTGAAVKTPRCAAEEAACGSATP
ncbi:unnamed protein product [Closterium sp. Naga37s-1]|nr:unnamed protein product [Closterium sp. Naga37s-1]